jgi:hypothetical protein
MSIRATLAICALLAALAAGFGPGASTSTAALVKCGKVSAGGKSWQVTAAALGCSTARSLVRQVATAKPDHVIRAAGGEIDQYTRSFSGFKCFKSRKTGVGGQIQCTNSTGKRSAFGSYRG